MRVLSLQLLQDQLLIPTFQREKLKILIQAMLLDRLTGLAALVSLFLFFLLFIEIPRLNFDYKILAVIGLALVWPIFYVGLKFIFPSFKKVFFSMMFFSFFVQIFQVVTVLCIMYSLHIADHFLYYLNTFLLSAVAAVIPISIGGAGTREVVFYGAFEFLNLNPAPGVALSIIFFFILGLCSLTGIFFVFNKKDFQVTNEEVD